VKKRILFISPYPHNTAGSQRFRFELYFEALRNAGFELEQRSFISESVWDILYKPGHALKKIAGVISGYLRRIITLFQLGRFDVVFVHREASPFGPAFFEYITAKWWKKPLIYDFDDAIWRRDNSDANKLMGWLKQPNKVASICKWATSVSAGNDYLAKYAERYNDNVHITPTCVDTEKRFNKIKDQTSTPVNIGWTGTNTTLKYLDEVVPVLQKLEQEYDFTFFVIADKKPDIKLKSLKFIKWSAESEVEDLLNFHIGLMPLEDDEWANGKCGFKAIQYMSLGIVPVVSPVGVNRTIVGDASMGYFCSTKTDWKKRIAQLLNDHSGRRSMGIQSTIKIKENYSVRSNYSTFLSMFKTLKCQ